jgi:hypothetical protein
MTYINEFGEIIRERDPNDKAEMRLSAGEGIMIFLANFGTWFLCGVFLFFNYKSKGYLKKSKQACNITWITVVSGFVICVIIGVIGG